MKDTRNISIDEALKMQADFHHDCFIAPFEDTQNNNTMTKLKLPRKLKKAIKNSRRTMYALATITSVLAKEEKLHGLSTTEMAIFDKAISDLRHPYPRTKNIRRLFSKIIYNDKFSKDLQKSSFNKYFVIKFK